MIIAGLMTGTSADALDVALAEFVHDPSADELGVRLLAGEEMPFDPALRTDILRLLEPVEPLSSSATSMVASAGSAPRRSPRCARTSGPSPTSSSPTARPCATTSPRRG